ncbi:MAG: 3-methyl-2-oxobutanoate hydroxymethyltransferase [Opitutales bacterium]|nr:3-methyl-2-oxobutanoate hydroxymethyltransferase [Opitutales bacterium]
MPEPKKTSQKNSLKEVGKDSPPQNRSLDSSRTPKVVDAPPKANRPRKPRNTSGPKKTITQERTADHNRQRTRTVLDLAKLKGKQTIVGLTAYDALLGRLVSESGVDFILVGDSVGTTMLGFATTIPVTIKDMIHHTAAVRRANPQCLLVADLPFGEASLSFDRLLDSARSLMQIGGADAVKIEGGKDIADDIEKLVATGIPVLGHIGLLPQTVKAIGGYRKFGADREEAESLYTDAISLEEAGCFAVIGEMIDENVATELTKQILPPLIGIGSGNGCDGQILVTTDLLGLANGPVPSFVKPRLDLSKQISSALTGYVSDLKKPRK